MSAQVMAADDEAERLVSQILDPANGGNRYGLYHRLRDIAPVHRTDHPLLNGWHLISGYYNCRTALTASQAVNNAKVLELMNIEGDGPFARMNRAWMEYQDQIADHDRIKKLFFSHFTPRSVNAHRELIRELVGSLLDALGDRDEFDVVADFAFPLPTLVITRVLGIALDDVPRFQHMMDEYLEATAIVRVLDDETRAGRDAMAEEFLGLFRQYLDERRVAPKDDLISKLAQSAAGAGVSDEELLAQFVFVLIAGFSTTADMIGNALFAMDQHPDQREAFANGKISARDAVKEFLRYDSSLEVGTRFFTADTEIAGVVIPAGAPALILFHSAHRDPVVYTEPDTLDFSRKFPQPAFAFGGGRYTCLGSALAMIELEEAMGALMRRYPTYTIKDVAWQGTLVSHGPKHLVIAR